MKYEAQIVIFQNGSSFLIGENHLDNYKTTIVPDRAQAMQRQYASTAS